MNPRLFLAAALLLGGAAQADTLDFGQGPAAPSICATASTGIGALSVCGNSSYLNQSYGDVAGALDVSYNLPRVGANTTLRWWADDYNKLFGVAWADGGDSNSHARIDLRVLDGSRLSLQSLDLGAYPDTTRDTTLTISDLASSQVLFTSTQPVGNGSVSATGFSFSNLSSLSGLRIEWQDSAYNVGIDNITYSITAVPEPGTWLLMAGGLLGVAALARRRQPR